jgi:hypothetical protein
MWRETTRHERNKKIWNEELEDFVPEKVLDFHVHIFPEGTLPEDKPFHSGGPAISEYTFEDLDGDLAEVYPGRETTAVCFGLPWPECDQELNNRYIADHADNRRYFGLRLLDPLRDTPESLRADLGPGKFLGVKPYPDYARNADVNETQIPEMLPDWAMEAVNDAGGIVMLHIPRRQRLADPLNRRQIAELCRKYPRARVVLAHLGRAYYLKCITGMLDELRDIPNLYYDLAMLNHWEVMEHAFQVLPGERLLYGTDIPIALAPGKSVEINHQYTYVTPGPWALSISDDHGKLVFTSFLYEELRAIRRAVERLGLGRDFVTGLFHGNGMRLLGQAMK